MNPRENTHVATNRQDILSPIMGELSTVAFAPEPLPELPSYARLDSTSVTDSIDPPANHSVHREETIDEASASTRFETSSIQSHSMAPLLSPQTSNGSTISSQLQQQQQESKPPPLQYDLLTIFQAAPLVYKDNQTGKLETLSLLDFDYERQVLTNAIAEANSGNESKKIHVDFQIATVDRLSYFLASEKGQIMHFSCHGNPRYLALENGLGELQRLNFQKLQEWIAVGGHNLQFVFVSACHSSFIGQAFVDAGVPHVVCCRHDSTIRESSAVEFEKTFYRNLACGTKNLQQAFDISKKEILFNPDVPAEDAAKFILLPSNERHDVPIFFQNGTKYPMKQFVPPVTFPPPPQIHLGRQLEQFKIIQAIHIPSRLIRVSGPVGVGKTDCVKMCLSYLNDRLHLAELDEIRWITIRSSPLPRKLNGRDVVTQLERIFDALYEDLGTSNTISARVHSAVQSLIDDCRRRKLLIVLDAKEADQQNMADKLGTIVKMLLEGTHHLQILIIHRDSVSVKTNRLSCIQKEVLVDRLSVEDTVDLFAFLLPSSLFDTERHEIGSTDQLCDLLLSHSTDLSTQRMKEIDQMLGSGIPVDIHRASQTFTVTDLEKLVTLGKYSVLDEDLNISSRMVLARRQKQIEEEIAEASASRDFGRCQELKTVLTELEVQKRRLPDLPSLQRAVEEKSFQLALAASSMDFENAQVLHAEVKRLEECINMESQIGQVESADPFETEVMETRAALEAKIWQLDIDYDAAFDNGNFDKAKSTVKESIRLKNLRSSYPTKSELLGEMNRLKSDLSIAKEHRRIDAGEMIFKRLTTVVEQLKLEEEAEIALGMNADDVQNQLDRENEARPPSTNDIEDTSKTSNGPILSRDAPSQSIIRGRNDPPADPPSRPNEQLAPGAFHMEGDPHVQANNQSESARLPSNSTSPLIPSETSALCEQTTANSLASIPLATTSVINPTSSNVDPTRPLARRPVTGDAPSVDDGKSNYRQRRPPRDEEKNGTMSRRTASDATSQSEDLDEDQKASPGAQRIQGPWADQLGSSTASFNATDDLAQDDIDLVNQMTIQATLVEDSGAPSFTRSNEGYLAAIEDIVLDAIKKNTVTAEVVKVEEEGDSPVDTANREDSSGSNDNDGDTNIPSSTNSDIRKKSSRSTKTKKNKTTNKKRSESDGSGGDNDNKKGTQNLSKKKSFVFGRSFFDTVASKAMRRNKPKKK